MVRCDKDDAKCKEKIKTILDGMETINDDVNNVGIEFVKTRERRLAKKEYGVTSFPALGLFRNGHFLGFEGELANPMQVINWLGGTDVLEVEGLIEVVTKDMLDNIIESEDDVLVFFYDKEETDDIEEIMESLKVIDDTISDEEVEFVSCSEERVVESFGLTMIPGLVYFENGVPSVYPGDLKSADTILGWITQELQQQVIKEVRPFVGDAISQSC